MCLYYADADWIRENCFYWCFSLDMHQEMNEDKSDCQAFSSSALSRTQACQATGKFHGVESVLVTVNLCVVNQTINKSVLLIVFLTVFLRLKSDLFALLLALSVGERQADMDGVVGRQISEGEA